MFPSLLIFLTSLVCIATGQDLGVPLSWRKFNNTRPFSERVTIAQNAINAIMPQLDKNTAEFKGIGYWQSGNVWSVLANQDRIAGSKVNQNAVVTNLNKAFSLHAHYDKFQVRLIFNDDALWWATAAVYAYRAYGDANLLSHAVDTWNHVNSFVVSPSQASSGKSPQKSFTLSGSCDGATMAGGVFWRPTADDASINSVTTGLYITLSAFLAEITGDAKYRSAAIQSANWIKAHNINSKHIVLDSVNGHDCGRSSANWLFTYNSGKFIEGLSVLAHVTGDAQWTNLMISVLQAAVKSAPWQGSDGIITEGSSPNVNNDGVGFKAVFIRGLHEAFERNPSNSGLRILIHSYNDVQYNALLDLAANGSTYSSNWHGPPQAFTSWGQLAALDVLTSAINTN